MIRLIIGFFITVGSLGTLETDPTASLLTCTLLAFVGIAILAWPVLYGTIGDAQIITKK